MPSYIFEHSQKLSAYFFQNYVAFYFELYLKQLWLTLIFGTSLRKKIEISH